MTSQTETLQTDTLAVLDLLADSLGRIAEALDYHLDGLPLDDQQPITKAVTGVLSSVEDLRTAIRDANLHAERSA